MSAFNFRKNTELDIHLSDGSYDTVDKPPNSYHVSAFSLFSLIYSIIFHCGDLGYDFYLAYSYASTEKYAYFIWTVASILLPAVIINLISINMYLDDLRKGANTRYALIRISLCVLGIPVQSALIIRYFDSLRYAIKSLKAESESSIKQQQKYFIKMLNEDSDAALLRIFECYLESAPQQILQATLLVKDYIQDSDENAIIQLTKIILGFITMGYGMASYQRCIRYDQQDKENISVLGLAVQFFWHINFTASRILAIAAVAVLYTFWTWVAVIIHWCAMTVWVALSSRSKFCGRNKILEILFYGVIGLVYIFNFLNLNEGPTRQSYVTFYLLCFVENIIAATIWGLNSVSLIKNWVYYIFLILPIFCFLLSVLFLIVYYQFVHPNIYKGSRNGRNQNA